MSISSGFQNFAGSFFQRWVSLRTISSQTGQITYFIFEVHRSLLFFTCCSNSLSFEGHQKQEERTIPESMGQFELTLLIELCGQLSQLLLALELFCNFVKNEQVNIWNESSSIWIEITPFSSENCVQVHFLFYELTSMLDQPTYLT